MKLEDYDEETYRYLYKISKEFHQETIHNYPTTQAKIAFANLLAEETNLTEEEIQAYLYRQKRRNIPISSEKKRIPERKRKKKS